MTILLTLARFVFVEAVKALAESAAVVNVSLPWFFLGIAGACAIIGLLSGLLWVLSEVVQYLVSRSRARAESLDGGNLHAQD